MIATDETRELTPFEKTLRALEDAIDAAKAECSKLPDFPSPPPECCANQTLRIIERGYTRETTVCVDDGYPIALTDGLDDFGEDGDFQYIRCAGCGQRWKTPEGLDYM